MIDTETAAVAGWLLRVRRILCHGQRILEPALLIVVLLDGQEASRVHRGGLDSMDWADGGKMQAMQNSTVVPFLHASRVAREPQ